MLRALTQNDGKEFDEEIGLARDNGSLAAMQATLSMAVKIGDDLPSEPKNRQEVIDSPKWDYWREAKEREMHSMMLNNVYAQVIWPKDKLVVGTKTLYTPKLGQDNRVIKYMCGVVSQGSSESRGALHRDIFAHASDRVHSDVFSDRGGKRWRAATLHCGADVVEGENRRGVLHRDPRGIPGVFEGVGLLNKAFYGLLQAGRCLNTKLCDDVADIGFEQCSERSLTASR